MFFSMSVTSAKKEYAEFLASDFWKEIRQRAIGRDGSECKMCGDIERLQVHHKMYIAVTGIRRSLATLWRCVAPAIELSMGCGFTYRLMMSEKRCFSGRSKETINPIKSYVWKNL
jgi:5-methylcytosine-specific restriction endonuclease McrA